MDQNEACKAGQQAGQDRNRPLELYPPDLHPTPKPVFLQDSLKYHHSSSVLQHVEVKKSILLQAQTKSMEK